MKLAVEIPSVGESITSGILSAWHVKDGDNVQEGQLLFELETDKITSEGIAGAAGTITIKIPEGEEVDIGQEVAEIDTTAVAPASPTPTPATPQTSPTTPPLLSPAVRRLARERGLSPDKLPIGTGKGGRLTKADLLPLPPPDTAAPATPPAPPVVATPTPDTPTAPTPPPATPPPLPPATPAVRTTRRKMSPLRRKIAQHLLAASQQTASLTTFNECDVSEVARLRKKHQEAFKQAYGIKLGFMSFFMKAVVEALRAVPQVNARLEEDTIVENHYYDIGVAVGTPKGLVVPVIRDAELKSLAEIERDIATCAISAREGKLSFRDLEGGVFTISNGGVYGSLLSTPLLNLPQSAILGLHKISERPTVVDGEVVARPMMYLALSYDHRLIDGQQAVQFLVCVKQIIESPERLFLGL